MRIKHSVERNLAVVTILVVTFVLTSGLSVSFISGMDGAVTSVQPASLDQVTGGNCTYVITPPAVHEFSGLSATISPASSVLDVGQSVTISVQNPSTNFIYSWFLNGVSVGTNASSYKFSPTAAGINSIYVNVTNGSAKANSNTSTVTVYSSLAVTISPSSEKANVGQAITFQPTVTGGTGTFTYLWYLNGSKTSTTTSTYTFTPTGNATYYVYVIVNDSGTSNGVPAVPTVKSNIAQITAVIVTYPVAVQESGLPAGTKWYVNLTNGQSHPEVGSLNLFYEPNGTYNFYIASGNKVYTPSPYYGAFVVDGNTVSLVVTFSLVLYQVTFGETGLPVHTTWYVNVSGQSGLSSNSTTIRASLSNGSYTFFISTGNKAYYPTPYSGSLKVNGHTISISVGFSLFTYPVEFTESGLPSNTQWFLSVSSNAYANLSNTSGSSFSQTISLDLPNGTYSYTITSGIQTFGPFPAAGNFTVSGSAVAKAVAFLRLYQITFVEVGLPIPLSYVKWFLNISDPQEFSSSSNVISFWEPNQTYSYSISTNDKWYVPSQSTQSGSFTVNGVSVINQQIVFNELLNVTFRQHKLPSGNQWYVNVTQGGTYSSTSSTISFTEINGTYSFTVSSGNKLYRPSPSSGSFIPNETVFPINVTFRLVTYQVSFSESGLTNGTIWSITLDNSTRISTNSSILFKLNNGSFEYSIQSIAGFSTSAYSGNLTVNGSSIVQSVNWTMVTYAINITQSGITVGKHWSVTLQGKTFNNLPVSITLNTTKSYITFHEPNGSYNYTINAPFGYTGNHVIGKITINGRSAAAVATLVPPNFTLIGVVGAFVVGLLAVALAFMIRHENRSFFVREGRYVRDGKYLKYKK